MKIIKLKRTRKYNIIVHPNKNIWKNSVNKIPYYIYKDLELNKQIESEESMIEWSKSASILINGNKYINFFGDQIKSKYSIDRHLLFGCWSNNCKVLSQDPLFNIQTVFDIHAKTLKPYTYTQCWMFAALFDCLCHLKGIKSRVVIGRYTKIDMNKNFIYDEGDSMWNFHVWNEIWFPKQKKWLSFDCCPGISMKKDHLFSMGPIDVKNKLNKNMRSYKYFKHLTTGKNVKIYTYKIDKIDGKYKIKKIIVNKRYIS